jgi:hypothetical protein
LQQRSGIVAAVRESLVSPTYQVASFEDLDKVAVLRLAVSASFLVE